MDIKGRILGLAAALVLAACARPIPQERAAYVGTWTGSGIALAIEQGGQVRYRRREGNQTVSINAPLQEFQGDNFVVGVGPVTTTFVVSKPPHQVEDRWKMTVDSVELTRVP